MKNNPGYFPSIPGTPQGLPCFGRTPSTSNELSVFRNGNQTAQLREVQDRAWLEAGKKVSVVVSCGLCAEQDKGACEPDWDTSLSVCLWEGRHLLNRDDPGEVPRGLHSSKHYACQQCNPKDLHYLFDFQLCGTKNQIKVGFRYVLCG